MSGRKGIYQGPQSRCITNHNLYLFQLHAGCQSSISWGYFPVSLFDILYLARDSLLWRLCYYFLLFVCRFSFFPVCVCVAQSREQELKKIKTSSYSMKKYQRLPYEFLFSDTGNYFLALFKLVTCKSCSSYCSSQPPSLIMSDVHFFSLAWLDCSLFELRTEITLQLRFVFVHHCDTFLLRHNYVIYLFDVATFFHDVRITLYFGTFELRTAITL